MSDASNYLEDMIINATLRGIAFSEPSDVYVALHDADPGETGANEVSTADWPSYAREDSTQGDTLANAWSAASNGSSDNQKQMIYPVFDGASALTVTHFSLWDAVSGGNMLVGAALDTSRTIQPGDVFVVDVDKLTVQAL